MAIYASHRPMCVLVAYVNSSGKSPEKEGQSSSGDRRSLFWSLFHDESVKSSRPIELNLSKI